MMRLLLILTFVFPVLFSAAVEAAGIDLTAEYIHVTKGFNREWTLKEQDYSKWLSLSPSKNGLRSVRVRELGLSDLPMRSRFSLRSFKPEHFTLVTVFTIDSQRIHGPVQGLFLRDIGHNWDVYLNGHLLRSEMYLDSEGYIASHRNYRDVLIPVNAYSLRQGKNILAIHIVGDPTDISTGLYRNGPYLLDDYETLESMRSEKVRLILMFTYLFVGIYHLLLFFYRRTEKFNLAFGVMTLFIFLYFFTRTYSIYALVPDTNILFRMEFIVLFLVLPAGMAFFDLLLQQKTGIFARIISGFYALLSLAVLFGPIPFCVDMLRVWQSTAIIPLAYILINVVRYYIRDVRSTRLMNGESRSAVTAAFITLGRTVSGNLMIAIVIIVASTIFDIIDAVFISLDIGVSKYTFLAVVIGMTIMLANRFIYVHRRVDVLNTDLERKVMELNSANEQIGLSEARYRALVEGANDVVFTLDDDLNFISANKTIEKYLKIKPRDITKYNFLDLVYEGGDVSMSREIIRETLEEFKKEKKPVSFRTEMTSAFAREPKVMRIRMQYINIEGKNEILGMASSEVEDSLMKYFVAEKQKFVIENFLITADEVSRRVTRNLVRYLDSKVVDMIRLALREIVINAIEHGNLNITFEEKSMALIEGNYMELVTLRQGDSECRQKRVTVEYSINPKRVVYMVSDEGEGFNFISQQETIDEVNAGALPHGRGITMARNVFDEVTYLQRGNSVQLIKKFQP